MTRRPTALAVLVLAALAVCATTSVTRAEAQAKLVRLPLPQYDGTLTPYTFELGYPLVTLVYDTLLWRDEQGVPRPWLASSVKRTAGGRRLTIRLRRGVRWHDGRPLTAADVAFTFEFVARRFHPRFTPELRGVERVAAAGPRTVTIDLQSTSLGFDDQPLADLPILPRHLWAGLPEGRLAPAGLPVGSGPYRLVATSPRRGYGFQANRAYFKGRPRVDRIRVPIIRQEGRTYGALRRRNVDMLPVGLPENAAKGLGGLFGINLKRGPSYSGTALLLNLRRAPFDRVAVRRALGRAFDLERIVENVGPGEPAKRGYVHPGSPWASRRVLQRFDPGGARRTLARLDPQPVRVLAPDNDPVRLEAGRQVVLALRRAGMNTTLVDVPRERLGDAIGENEAGPDFEAAIVSTPPLASYDPNFLERLFGADSRQAPLNYGGYRSAAFRAAAERVARAPDRAARRRAVSSELAVLARELPAIPLFFSEGTFAFRPAIHNGWVFVRGTGILDKRSFLATRAGAGSRPAGGEDGEPDDPGTSVLDILSVVSLGVLAVVLGLAVVGLSRRRKASR